MPSPVPSHPYRVKHAAPDGHTLTTLAMPRSHKAVDATSREPTRGSGGNLGRARCSLPGDIVGMLRKLQATRRSAASVEHTRGHAARKQIYGG